MPGGGSKTLERPREGLLKALQSGKFLWKVFGPIRITISRILSGKLSGIWGESGGFGGKGIEKKKTH